MTYIEAEIENAPLSSPEEQLLLTIKLNILEERGKQ